MQINEVFSYIYQIPKFSTKNSREHTIRFLELLGHPEKSLKVIHVAGTNGKGSTCAYMNSILCREFINTGKSVGLFTSPHLQRLTERIRVNGEEITEEEFVRIFRAVMAVVEVMKEEGDPHPTFFEFLFGMALRAFAEAGVEYAILETGLGGRLDATNVIENPLITIITSIGLDHMEYLGDSVKKIAYEKAGIIKSGVSVICDGKSRIVRDVISRVADERGSRCRFVSDSAYEIREINQKYIAFSLLDEYDSTVTWKIRNTGKFQVNNACLALLALREALDADEERCITWRQALYETYWPGRMEELEPKMYIDGAHNEAAISAIAEDGRKIGILIYATVADKNYKDIIELITKKLDVNCYIVTSLENDRGVKSDKLSELFQVVTSQRIYETRDVKEAWELARKLKRDDEMVLALGSLYLVGEIKDLYRE